MVEETKYIKAVESFFSFLESEFSFRKLKVTVNGNAFYDVEYQSLDKVISISYETLSDHLEVILFILSNGKLPDYDDKSKTLHLNRMNELAMLKMNKIESSLNAQYFSKYIVEDELERKLLKGASELRLYLKHINR